MQYKLAKFWLGNISKIFLFATVVYSSAAHATLTVNPVDPYTLNNGVVNYSGKTGPGTSFMDSGFTDYNLKKQKTDEDGTNRPNMLLFDISSDTLTGSNLVIVIKATQTSSSTQNFIPIISVGGNDCSDANCKTQSIGGVNFSPYFYAANYTQKTTLRIGIYPLDICANVGAQSGNPVALGCTVGLVSTTFPVQFKLTFSAGVLSTATPPDLGSTPTAETTDRTLNFQSGAPPSPCSSLDLTNLYFPGDGEIKFNAGDFPTATTSGNAPVDTVLVSGKESATPTGLTTLDFISTNDISARLPISKGSQSITGFKNKTSSETHPYTLTFTTRDSAGVIAPFDTSACLLAGVETSPVLGFLSKSTCFIATASFRSMDVYPVALLREFRSEVLLKLPLGRFFVHQYYHYSPQAAIWLVNHPVFRFPVLTALAPLEVSVWLLMHLKIWFLALFTGSFIGLFLRKMRTS